MMMIYSERHTVCFRFQEVTWQIDELDLTDLAVALSNSGAIQVA